MNKFIDSKGNQVKIPLISKIQFLNNELYVQVDDYLEASKDSDTDSLL